MMAADTPFPMQWPVRPVANDRPELRVVPYKPPVIPPMPTVARPSQPPSADRLAAMVRADDAREEYERHLRDKRKALWPRILEVHVGHVSPQRRSPVPIVTRIVRWLTRDQ